MEKSEIANFKVRVLKHVSTHVKEQESDDIIPTLMYIRTGKGRFKIMPVHPALLADKALRNKCRDTIKYMLKIARADMLCFVSEAYVSKINADSLTAEEKRTLDNRENLSDEVYKRFKDKRTDCVFLNFEMKHNEDNNEFMVFSLEDHALKPYGELSDQSPADYDAMKGIFLNLLKE